MQITFILLIAAMLLLLNFNHRKEQKRNRVLQGFIAGIIRSISDYNSQSDCISDLKDFPNRNDKIPIPYQDILNNINWEFYKDFWIEPLQKFVKRDRNLFDESKYGNDGYNFMYLDFFDRIAKEWKV